MKKSEMYKTAQLAVIREPHIPDDAKLEILRELIERENFVAYDERRAAENGEL